MLKLFKSEDSDLDLLTINTITRHAKCKIYEYRAVYTKKMLNCIN